MPIFWNILYIKKSSNVSNYRKIQNQNLDDWHSKIVLIYEKIQLSEMITHSLKRVQKIKEDLIIFKSKCINSKRQDGHGVYALTSKNY